MNDDYDDVLLSKNIDALKLVYSVIGSEGIAKRYIELFFSNKGIKEDLIDRRFSVKVTVGFFVVYYDIADKLYDVYYNGRFLHTSFISKEEIIPSLITGNIERLCCEV